MADIADLSQPECIRSRCFSPVACRGFGYCRELNMREWHRGDGCANGMPGHPPCRSPAELEAMLRAQADTTAARESV